MKNYTLAVLILVSMAFFGCKSAPATPQVAPAPEVPTLTQDEIDVIDAAIQHIMTYELREIKSEMQVCINNVFFVHNPRSADSYDIDTINTLASDEKVVASFIDRNKERRTIEKDVAFKSDFFWNGDKPSKPYFRAIFSNIGFDIDSAESHNTKALIHVSIDIPEWKFGEYIYLEKNDGVWTFNQCLSSWKS